MHRLLLLFAFIATTAAAAPTRFVVEAIDVEGTRIRPAIIRAETRLVAGREYTTDDVDQAVYRVRRLPFVVGATYRLEPGSSAASQRLVISVVDENRFNFRIEGEADQSARQGSGRGTAWGLADADYRVFAGSRGVADVTFGYSSVGGAANGLLPRSLYAVGPRSVGISYGAYGLFGTSAFAQIGVSKQFYNGSDHTQGDLTPSVLLGVPLTRTQTLTLSGSRVGLKIHNEFSGVVVDAHSVRWSADLRWNLETTDDPNFTSRGTFVSIGPWYAKDNTPSTSVSGLPNNPVVRQTRVTTRETGFGVDGAKYWPWRGDFSTFVRGSAFEEHLRQVSSFSTSTTKTNRERLLFGIAFNSGQPLWVEDMTRHHLELAVGYGAGRNDDTFLGLHRSNGIEGLFAWAYRTRRGTIRITFSVIHD